MGDTPEIPVWEWREAFLEHCKLDPLTRLVGLAIAEHAKVSTGRHAYPGYARLRKVTGIVDVRTIRSRVKLLEESGWLQLVHKGSSPLGGKRRAREWNLTIRPGTPHVPSQDRREDVLGTSGADDWAHAVQRPGTPDATPSFPEPLLEAAESIDVEVERRLRQRMAAGETIRSPERVRKLIRGDVEKERAAKATAGAAAARQFGRDRAYVDGLTRQEVVEDVARYFPVRSHREAAMDAYDSCRAMSAAS